MDFSCGDPVSELRKLGLSKRRAPRFTFCPTRRSSPPPSSTTTRLPSGCARWPSSTRPGDHPHRRAHRRPKTGEARRAEFKYAGGIAEFVKHLNRGKTVLHDKPIMMEAMRDNVEIEIALQYNDSYSETVFSFANNINTVDGGRTSPASAPRLPAPSTPSASRSPLQGPERRT